MCNLPGRCVPENNVAGVLLSCCCQTVIQGLVALDFIEEAMWVGAVESFHHRVRAILL